MSKPPKKTMQIKPKKSLGQNWLINPRILDKITVAANISKKDLVIEIGPGTGNLTEKLAQKAGLVVAIEKDRRLIDILKGKFKNQANIKIIESDILTLGIETLNENGKFRIEDYHYKVVANIPYYITSRFLRKIFEEWPKPELIVLTIQKEVARRIMAKPPHMNLLALSVQYYSEPEIINYVSKGNYAAEKENIFFKLIRTGFSGKRKQLAVNLATNFNIKKGFILEKLKKIGINPHIRAENLSIKQWQELLKLL